MSPHEYEKQASKIDALTGPETNETITGELPSPSSGKASRSYVGKVNLISAAKLIPEPVQWIWEGWLAKGKFHLLAGDAGEGKTTLAIDMAARLSRGGTWPDGTKCNPAKVIIWSGEDHHSDGLVPKLKAAHANIDNCHFIENYELNGKVFSFNPATNISDLERTCNEIGNVGLIIVDPIVSAINGDANGNPEVRRDLQPIVDLASKCGVAILGISHFKKGNTDGNLLHRVTGSIAFGALARIVMAVGRVQDQDGNTNRILVRAKSNLGISDGGFEYSFDARETHPGIKATYITWKKYLEGSPQSLLSALPEDDWERQSAVDEAKDFLLTLLKEQNLKATEVEIESKNAGIQISALKRAKRVLKIKSIRTDGYWEWSLPNKVSMGVVT